MESETNKKTIYQQFEHAISIIIASLNVIMILAATWGLMIEVYHLVLHGAFDSLTHEAFQSAFGMIMTLLIALEFGHSIVQPNAHSRSGGIIKTQAIVLIAILAISREFIVFQMQSYSASLLAAYAVSLLSLGIVYRLIRDKVE
jgi:uncharacterized membrane protein (DUF373 family)